MVTYYGFAYVMGFAFHLLIVNHKQNESIRKQNAVLEQYMSQIERITLAEERNRLSSELHDTVGHAYTSIIMGMETLRTELATEMGIQRLDSLLEMGRKKHRGRERLPTSNGVSLPITFLNSISPKSWSRISGARSG